ncbi:hypothetical protein M404DRAFT_155309 [Pisolithus tinctorius Marx 270]|uniref:DUF659 domain-containing protein n=1 Tax=Pisolithus tinctorius Marx 270 TaxID=870435 RepID=A0A0C3IR96_PISTI|nr:hypothetical protein M404DRAFT_155309 [Pisolithus tinctorius Marx 270]
MPGSKQLSGRILDKEATKVVKKMKTAVHGKFATGQCNGWKNVNKASIIASTINVEYSPYLLNTTDISAQPKTAEWLLEIVMAEIAYATNTLNVRLIAWCSDAGRDSSD